MKLAGVFLMLSLVRLSNMVMLKKIPKILSPEILSVLARMGHGDKILLADGNFPSSSIAKSGPEIVRADGHGCVPMLKAVLELLPIDTYDYSPVTVMKPTVQDRSEGVTTPIWDEYVEVIREEEGRNITLYQMDKYSFYVIAKTVFAIVATGEKALYGSIMIQKGVL